MLLLAAVMAILSVLISAAYGTNDFSYISKSTYFFRQIIIYLFLLTRISKKHGEDNLSAYFIYYFALTHAIYVIGTLVLVMIPQIKDIWFSVFAQTAGSEARLDNYGYTLRMGWQGYAGFRLTLRCSLSIVLLLSLKTKSGELLDKKHFLVPLLLCLFGNMFYGRSGLSASAIVIVMWLLKEVPLRPKVIIGVLVAILSIGFLLNCLKNSPLFATWYDWMTKPFLSLAETGDMNNASFDRLQEMNSIDISPKTFLIGDGRFMEDGHYYMRTDAGFMRSILYWGIAGSIIAYGTVLVGLMRNRQIGILAMIGLTVVFLIFEYKGDVYYEFIPLLAAMSFSNKKGKRND